jgi:hypothetical protein
MTEVWAQAALWLGLALVATLISIWLRIATALSEIVVGTVAQLIIGASIGTALLHTDDRGSSSSRARVRSYGLSSPAPELDPAVFKLKCRVRGDARGDKQIKCARSDKNQEMLDVFHVGSPRFV